MKEKYLDYHGVTVLWAEIKKFVRSLVDNAQGAMTGRIIFGGSVDEVFDGSEDVYVNIPSSTTPGTTDYRELRNLPSINGIELFGNRTTDDLKIKIPTKLSQLSNDRGFLTEHQSLAGYATTASVEAALEDKLTKTEAEETYQTKGNYLTAIPQEYVTDTELAAYTYNKDVIDGKIANGGNFDSSLYYTKKNINDLLANKQNAISDLEVIRAGANLGVTALQPSNEADPTVPAWAKSPNKPTYTASEVGALPSTTHIPNEQEIRNCINVTANTIENGVKIAEVNGTSIYAPVAGETSIVTNTVQSDWEEDDNTKDAYIKNKPTIPTAVSELDNDSNFLTEQDVAAVALSGSYNDLTDKPTISGNYLSLDGGTISGELTIDNSSLGQDAHAPLFLKYDPHISSPIITILADDTNTLCYINFPDKTCTLAPTESPYFTGNPRAVTVGNSDSSSTIATTRFVHNIVNSIVPQEANDVKGGKVVYYNPNVSNTIYIDGQTTVMTSFTELLTDSVHWTVLQSTTTGMLYKLSKINYITGYTGNTSKINQLTFTNYNFTENSLIKSDIIITLTDPVETGNTYNYTVTSVPTIVLAFNQSTQVLDIKTDSSVTIPTPSEVPSSDLEPDTTDYSTEYFTIKSLENNNVISFDYTGSTTGKIETEISTDDGANWEPFCIDYNVTKSGLTADSITLNADEKLIMRGTNDTYSIGNSNIQLKTTKQFNLSGNIMSLVHSDNFIEDVTISAKAFQNLFSGCEHLKSAKNLILPATELQIYCYLGMFRGCTNLIAAPELPATAVSEYCYQDMFNGCTSLTTAPNLPVNSLREGCYKNMFKNCISLAIAPKLPATVISTYCYKGMFEGCTSLINAPELKYSLMLPSGCYEGMFKNCTSLIDTPYLYSRELGYGCYASMFEGCTSLTETSILLATSLAGHCYENMFKDCTSLVEAPTIRATELENYCCCGMFSGCTSLIQAPELKAATLANHCYDKMFQNCTNLNYVKILATEVTNASLCFDNWLTGVAAGGTIEKYESLNISDYIPSDWIINSLQS